MLVWSRITYILCVWNKVVRQDPSTAHETTQAAQNIRNSQASLEMMLSPLLCFFILSPHTTGGGVLNWSSEPGSLSVDPSLLIIHSMYVSTTRVVFLRKLAEPKRWPHFEPVRVISPPPQTNVHLKHPKEEKRH